MKPSRLERLGDAIDGWEPLILLGLIMLLLLGGFALPRLGKLEAIAMGFCLPVVALIAAGVGLRSHRGLIFVIGLMVCAAAFFASEEQVSEVLFPHQPLEHANLRPDETATVDAHHFDHFRVEVHGDVHGDSAEGTYNLRFDRGDATTAVSGRLERKVRQTRKGTRTNLHLTDRHDVSIGGDGPLRVTVTGADKALKLPLLVEVRTAPSQGPLARWMLLACLVAAALLEVASTYRGRRLRLTIAVGMVMAFSEFVAASYNPDSPLRFMVAAVLFGAAAGGAGGWLAGTIAIAVFGKRQPRSPTDDEPDPDSYDLDSDDDP